MSTEIYKNLKNKTSTIRYTSIPSIMEKLLEITPRTKEEERLIDLVYIQLNNAALFLEDCNSNFNKLVKINKRDI